MKISYVIVSVIACSIGLSYLSLSGVFDRGSMIPTPLVNEEDYAKTHSITQQGADDKRKNPYNNPDIRPENEEFNGRMRYTPHAIEMLRPAIQ